MIPRAARTLIRGAYFDSARSAGFDSTLRRTSMYKGNIKSGVCNASDSSEERKGGRAFSLSLSLKRARQGPKEKRGIQIAAMHHARELVFSMLVI